MSLRSTSERRKRILPLDRKDWNGPEGEDGCPLPRDGVVYVWEDIADSVGLHVTTVEAGFSGEVDCLRDVSLWVAGKIFEREAEVAHKRKVRGRRKILI